MAECPYCHGQISQLGAQPWLHLRDCLSGHWASQFDKLALPAHRARADPAADRPVGLAADRARARTALVTALTAALAAPPARTRAALARTAGRATDAARTLAAALGDAADRCAAFAVPRRVAAASTRFYDSLDLVDACASAAELRRVHAALVRRGALRARTADPAACTTPFLLAAATQRDLFDADDDDYEEPAPLPRLTITYL